MTPEQVEQALELRRAGLLQAAAIICAGRRASAAEAVGIALEIERHIGLET